MSSPAGGTPVPSLEMMQGLGARITRRRQEIGMSQEELAALSGMHRNQVSNIERARGNRGTPSNPQLGTLLAVAATLGVAPVELLPELGIVPAAPTRGRT